MGNLPKKLERTRSMTLGGTVIQHTMVNVKISDGKAYAATAAAGYRCAGIATEGGASGEEIIVDAGIYLMTNSGSNALTDVHIGNVCYVEDANTVSSSGTITTGVVAGLVVDVVSEGVWVDFGVQYPAAQSAT